MTINKWGFPERDRFEIIKDGTCACLKAIALLLLWLFIFLCLTVRAEENWSNDEIVNAIYKAEGGARAQHPYGIRSVNCASVDECRKICQNTVKKNRVRYAKYGYKRYAKFIDFLGSRYCPTSGQNLKEAEKRLNGNWIKNVNFWLVKNRGIK